MSNESTIKIEAPVQANPLYQVLTSMPRIEVTTAAAFQDETLGKDLRLRSPTGLLHRPGSDNQEIELIDPRQARLPRR